MPSRRRTLRPFAADAGRGRSALRLSLILSLSGGQSRQKRQLSPALMKSQPVAEQIALVRFKSAPVRHECDAPALRLIQQDAELDAPGPARLQLFDHVLL